MTAYGMTPSCTNDQWRRLVNIWIVEVEEIIAQ